MTNRYIELAEYLSDHLWMRNSLDFNFLKTFPEFLYSGVAYRTLFLDKLEMPKSCVNQSFSKTLTGVREYIYNAQNFDKDFVENKKPFTFRSQIEGFDLQKALLFFKKNGGLTEKTIENFLLEEEVLAYSHSNLELVEIN